MPKQPSTTTSDVRRKEKLTHARIATIREMVEGTDRSYKRIGKELGVSASTVSRYATAGEWHRPPGAALPARIARQQAKTTERLWRLTAQRAKNLRDKPVELTQRSLQPLASLTRALGSLNATRPPSPVADEPHCPSEDVPAGRSINELRDELFAHLIRIEEEEAAARELWEGWFDDGAGI
ncbi:hypothetical protein [Microvirga terricola]|uniref:Homeodomain-like domain-containing protein n=1 Tax=Microvirga terricola TaxID=2719797 RepID=A0ABX0VBE4_9HYPH|nr:hypothetical protein [Microvirga terricola]NIX76676.1 hypothetical protein [Microvirga terricola]